MVFCWLVFVCKDSVSAASSVINDGVFVKCLWNFLPKVPFHSLTEMDGNKINLKKKERERGRRTEETINFEGLNRSGV